MSPAGLTLPQKIGAHNRSSSSSSSSISFHGQPVQYVGFVPHVMCGRWSDTRSSQSNQTRPLDRICVVHRPLAHRPRVTQRHIAESTSAGNGEMAPGGGGEELGTFLFFKMRHACLCVSQSRESLPVSSVCVWVHAVRVMVCATCAAAAAAAARRPLYHHRPVPGLLWTVILQLRCELLFHCAL